MVSYDVGSVPIDGVAPLTSTFSIGVKISGPGSTQLDRPVSVSLQVELDSAPPGTDEALALSFITISPATFTVSNADEFVSFTGTYTVPEGMAPGDYSYKLTTLGWDAGYDRFTSYVDNGTFVNVTLVPPPPPAGPPSVTISSPAAMEEFTYTVGGPPVQVPVAFTAVADPETPITALSAVISGQTLSGITVTGLNSAEATGTTFVPFTTGGDYTLQATGSNIMGSSTASVDFFVRVIVPPPVVTINTPLDGATYEMILGGAGLEIPYDFTVTSLQGGIGDVGATLNGQPLSVTPGGLGTLAATGEGVMNITQPGTYTLSANGTRSTDGVTVSSSVTFTVVGIIPPPTVEIHTPEDGLVVERLAIDPPSLIDYTFTASAAASAIDTVVVTINGVVVEPSALNGLNTGTVTGSGTFATSTPLAYTLTVTAFSAGQQADDSVSFSVQEGVVSPPTVTILTPEEGLVLNRFVGAPATEVPYTFVAVASAGVIDAVEVLIGGNVVVPTELNGLGTASVSGSGLFTTTTAGTRSITVNASGPSGSATDTVSFSIVEQTVPPPVVEFTSPEDGLVVERLVGDDPNVVSYTFLAMAEVGVIDAITLTQNGTTITPTLEGLGTPDVIGTGTVTLTTPGAHVLNVTAFSNGMQASDSVTVNAVINEPPPPGEACGKINWLVPFSHGRTIVCGSTMAIRFRIVCEGKNVVDPEVVVAIFEQFADGTSSEPEIFPWGNVPHSGTYKYTGNHYHLNFQTASTGSRVYRVEVYRPVTPGSTTMGLLDSRELRTRCDGKSVKSGKSDKSDKSVKSSKSGKSDKSDKSNKWGKSDKSDKSGKSDKSSKWGKSDKSGKSSKSSGKGNPGNDKPVGEAGETPNGKSDWGSGSKGMSDADKKSSGSKKSNKSIKSWFSKWWPKG